MHILVISPYLRCRCSGSQEYTQSSLNRALQLQSNMEADMGGTEILQPLKYLYEQKPIPGQPRQVTSQIPVRPETYTWVT
jgi:hypothetical protein